MTLQLNTYTVYLTPKVIKQYEDIGDHSLPMSEQLSSWSDICQTKAKLLFKCTLLAFITPIKI